MRTQPNSWVDEIKLPPKNNLSANLVVCYHKPYLEEKYLPRLDAKETSVYNWVQIWQ